MLETIFFIIFGIFGLAIHAYIIVRFKKRVLSDLEELGYTVFSCSWRLFSWDQTYKFQTQYLDKQGNLHEAMIKIRPFDELHFAEDIIIKHASEEKSE